MTTVFDVSLRMAKEVMDVIEGTATGGSTTTLVDTAQTTQANDYYNGGMLWIKSGTHAGKVFAITDYAAGGTFTFTAVTGAIAAGVRYAVARSLYPWDRITSSIQTALDSTWVTDVDTSLEGDGETLEFTLPTDVKRVYKVETVGDLYGRSQCSHWRETHDGKLRFDYGYPPRDGETIHVYYKAPHDEITGYTTEISRELDLEWLKYAATRELLYWGVQMYGQQAEYRIEEKMNKVLALLKGKTPRLEPLITVRSGAY